MRECHWEEPAARRRAPPRRAVTVTVTMTVTMTMTVTVPVTVTVTALTGEKATQFKKKKKLVFEHGIAQPLTIVFNKSIVSRGKSVFQQNSCFACTKQLLSNVFFVLLSKTCNFQQQC